MVVKAKREKVNATSGEQRDHTPRRHTNVEDIDEEADMSAGSYLEKKLPHTDQLAIGFRGLLLIKPHSGHRELQKNLKVKILR